MEHAVDAVTDPDVALLGLDVDVRRAVVHGLRDEQVHELHDRRFVDRLLERGDVVGFRLFGRGRCGEVADLGVDTRDALDRLTDIGARRDDDPYVTPG